MITKLLEDISTITTIPLASLQKLSDLSQQCICHAITETLLQKELITTVNIGIGKLLIKQEENSIKYKFIPSSDFEQAITDTIVNRKSPIISNAEQTLASRIIKTYKDLL